jgi:hypothetical protein
MKRSPKDDGNAFIASAFLLSYIPIQPHLAPSVDSKCLLSVMVFKQLSLHHSCGHNGYISGKNIGLYAAGSHNNNKSMWRGANL